jgi:predicted transcriptional regulator
MKVLLSIKPEFVEKIFDGTKRVEFRRIIFKSDKITSIVVYASSPIQKIIGEFEVDSVLSGSPEYLWHETSADAGISKSYFDQYFADKLKGYAIKIKSVNRYKDPLCLKLDYHISHPPQSFQYLVND